MLAFGCFRLFCVLLVAFNSVGLLSIAFVFDRVCCVVVCSWLLFVLMFYYYLCSIVVDYFCLCLTVALFYMFVIGFQ